MHAYNILGNRIEVYESMRLVQKELHSLMMLELIVLSMRMSDAASTFEDLRPVGMQSRENSRVMLVQQIEFSSWEKECDRCKGNIVI